MFSCLTSLYTLLLGQYFPKSHRVGLHALKQEVKSYNAKIILKIGLKKKTLRCTISRISPFNSFCISHSNPILLHVSNKVTQFSPQLNDYNKGPKWITVPYFQKRL